MSEKPGSRKANGLTFTIGLGTWQTDGQTTIKAVTKALHAGYRLIDTAAAYGNETFVGQGIKESGIDREELFMG